VPVLDIQSLVKRYRNGTMANDGISLAIEEGELFGLLGPNGAGKTTLVGQLLGLLKPTAGSIQIDGVDVVARPGYAREQIGFLPQAQVAMDDVHIDELIFAVARLRGLSRSEARARTEALIERLQLSQFRATSMRAASGGVRRLAGFATAVVAPARIVVLDEPTNDVDPLRRRLLWDAIAEMREEGTTVLLVTHNLHEAERFLDRLAIIEHGRIVREGAPADLRSVVTERLRLEVTATNGLQPHPALDCEPDRPGSYLFDNADLVIVSSWLEERRKAGEIVDFRIGPPSLEDIYAASVGADTP